MPQDFLDYIRQDTRTAAEVMVRHVITVAPDSSLPEIAELMVKHGIKRVPVLKDGRVVGIVSRGDLVAVLSKAPGMLV